MTCNYLYHTTASPVAVACAIIEGVIATGVLAILSLKASRAGEVLAALAIWRGLVVFAGVACVAAAVLETLARAGNLAGVTSLTCRAIRCAIVVMTVVMTVGVQRQGRGTAAG